MSQSLVRINVHLVFSTKNRIPMIPDGIRPSLHAFIGHVLQTHNAFLIKAGGTRDHIHLVISLGKELSISDAVREVKSKSSGWIHREYRRLRRFAWQGGYAGFSVSESDLESVIRYVENQEEHHRGRTFKDELRALLRAHQIDYDERYLWE